jgi:hypothetical protein
MELNLIGMTAKERWELYQVAESLGLFWKLPPQPKPLSQPLVHLYQIGAEKQLRPYIEEGNPELTDTEKRACMFAWHVWRERTDVWEMPSWQDVEYDPGWLRDGYSNFLLYNQFVSAFELERYFVNPWVRASAWLTTLNLLDLEIPPKFDMSAKLGSAKASKSERKHTRTVNHFQAFVNQVPNWWAGQKDTVRFSPVPELALATSGYVSVALRDLPSSPQPDRLIEGNWHNGWGNGLVNSQKLEAFSWVEFMWRRDELNFVLPNVINQMLALGPRGASKGEGNKASTWTAERKLLNRLTTRVKTMSRYADAIGEIADGKLHS